MPAAPSRNKVSTAFKLWQSWQIPFVWLLAAEIVICRAEESTNNNLKYFTAKQI